MEIKEMIQIGIQSGLFLTIVTAAVSGIKLLKAMSDAKLEQIAEDKEHKQQAKIAGALQKIDDSAWSVVMQLADETVDNLKAKAEDGKLTPIEIEELRTTAYTRVKQLVGDETYKLAQQGTNDLQTWILTKIDAYARVSKTN